MTDEQKKAARLKRFRARLSRICDEFVEAKMDLMKGSDVSPYNWDYIDAVQVVLNDLANRELDR
jgi:hypothetical protein